MAGPSHNNGQLDWSDLPGFDSFDLQLSIDPDLDNLLYCLPETDFSDLFTMPVSSAGAGTVQRAADNAVDAAVPVPDLGLDLFSHLHPENLLADNSLLELTLPSPPPPPPRHARILPEEQVMDIRKHLTHILLNTAFNVDQKQKIIESFPEGILVDLKHTIKHGEGPVLPTPSPPGSPERSEHDSQRTLSPFTDEPNLNEDNYLPIIQHDHSFADPAAPQPVYPAFVGHFRSGAEARRHRRRARYPPKTGASDVARVKRYGRQFWVQEIYEAMIDIGEMADGKSSIHRNRFIKHQVFDPMDLEATAHHVFDAAIAVHEKGWSRPTVYHKKVVRGKLTDVSEKSVETRLSRICMCFRQNKATVDDAIRGGVTLALLCDNPEARGFTKASNNTGNERRGERLRMVKNVQTESGSQEPEQREGQQELEQNGSQQELEQRDFEQEAEQRDFEQQLNQEYEQGFYNED